ncbi:hypothetical protein glysoja_044751 [Glycine soja]|uniref:Putative plant transposon protein domain-containing protein n=1 Tax=Glycine soja TaxID=3848 RepID=A0A0B2SLG1_GLYSO|nr:hypothetical protein glysoja_044751 [Glycine soja]
MASKKHKNSDSRPLDQNDNRRFQSEEAWKQYIDNILDRRILPERNVELYHSEFDEFKIELERRNLYKHLANLQERSIDMAVVKEFYANFYSPADQAPKCAKIRGHLIKIDADNLNEFLQTPVLLEEEESLPTYSRFCRLRPDPKEMEARLCIPGKGFILNIEGQPWKLLRKDLTTLAQTWSVFSYSNLAPTSRTSYLNTDRARPAIDLAYIIRNCWNANDQTVNFLEARKTKLRAANVPFSFAPIVGIPASSTSAPLPALADLSAQSSQTSNAKLQSLFEG